MIRNFCLWLICLAALANTFASCSEDKLITQKKTCKMTLIGDIQDSGDNTRSESSTWSNGDKIHILFKTEKSSFPGEATYNTDRGWEVTFTGTFAEGENLSCSVYYFTNASETDSYGIDLNQFSEIYEDMTASYSYLNDALILRASLTPKTGRIRFTGNAGDQIHIFGLSTYKSFVFENGAFYSTTENFTLTVDNTGSTPYIYGYFADQDYRKLGVVTATDAYTRECPQTMFSSPNSGYMAIPTLASHSGWQDKLHLRAAGVQFKMIPVTDHSSGFYMIGETEVTEELYYAVMGGSSTKSQYPLHNIESIYFSLENVVDNFYDRISSLMALNFSMPTYEQLTYAAKGGSKSKGYTYSGSNSADEVSWYSGNATSVKEVKTKAPNELGIYDLSGNVCELYSYYIYSGSYLGYYTFGGSYLSEAGAVTVTASNMIEYNQDSDLQSIGIRLVLTL